MEKLTELEARQKRYERDYAHEVTIFKGVKGVIGAQGTDIEEIKIDIRGISQRLDLVQEEISGIKAEIGGIKVEMGDMKTDIRQILTLLTRGKSEL